MKEQFKEKEKSHKINLLLYTTSKAIENFALRAFWLFYNNLDLSLGMAALLGLGRFIIRLIPFIVVYGSILGLFHVDSTFLLAAIVYVVMYLITYGIFRLLRQKFENNLYKLQEECEAERQDYFTRSMIENNIMHGVANENIHHMEFEDGMVVNNRGWIATHAPRVNVPFKLYSLKNHNDLTQYSNIIHNSLEPLYTMEKSIASIEFNKNYAIVIDAKDERECMKYFSPRLQSEMVKSTILPQCFDREITCDCFEAQTECDIEFPPTIDLFKMKSIYSYFKEIDKYCKKFSEFANKIHTDLSKITF